MEADNVVPVYLVTVETPEGTFELEVPTLQGPNVAGRRAHWVAVSQLWGDVEDVKVISIKPIEPARTWAAKP